ncbi:MAG: hypothetical protein FH758_14755 [Firmicutes bacterium]|nr:hypothetical protein [Bacillota bacterium]
MEDNPRTSGPVNTIIQLLDAQSEYNVSQTNMLTMLSLVNLMGIVDVLQRSTGGEGLEVEVAPKGTAAPRGSNGPPNDELMDMVQQAASGNLNPANLLGLLNRQGGGQNSNHAALLNLLSQMMPPPPTSDKYQGQKPPPSPKDKPQGPKPSSATVNEKNSEFKKNEMPQVNKRVEEEKRMPGQKPNLKWDPRLG